MQETYKQSFKKDDTNNLDLSIYNSGLQRCETGHAWGPGVRDHYLIHLVISGKGSYTTNNRKHEISAGDLFLAKPNQRIYYSADEQSPWEYYWVGFNGTNASTLVHKMPFTEEKPFHSCTQTERAKELLHKIYLSRGPEPTDEAKMVGYLYLFVSLLLQEAKNQGKRIADTGSQYVLNAVKYIQFNYSHNIGVDDIADAVGVSRSHLYRVFMSNTGLSPIDYLTNFRIGEACALLEKTTLSVAEIAYSVGFFDQFYFSRVFKKAKGMPPSKYLAKIRNAE